MLSQFVRVPMTMYTSLYYDYIVKCHLITAVCLSVDVITREYNYPEFT